MVARLMVGFYWKTSSNKLVNALVKTYCVTIATVFNIMSITYITNEDEHIPTANTIYMAFVICLYDIIVVVNLFYTGEYLEDFFDKMENPAIAQDMEAGDKLIVTTAVIIFSLTTKFITGSIYIYEKFTLTNTSKNFILLIMQIINPISNFTRIMVFELLWRRMAMLRKSLQQDLTSARMFEGEEIFKTKLRTSLIKYQLILDTLKKIKHPIQFLVIVSFMNYVKSSYHMPDKKKLFSVVILFSDFVKYSSLYSTCTASYVWFYCIWRS
ncbi:hypothetical protein B5X24_HaOG200907 [Helicoverpa armigera]|nr:hypothetical protein B5X24_HaOG200907 [Helicoverpa armigera]